MFLPPSKFCISQPPTCINQPPTFKMLYKSVSHTQNGVSNPDMKPYSGDILYIENRTNVTRATNQIEDFKIVLEF